MAISDLLLDTAEQVEDWLKEFPQMYSGERGIIDPLLEQMRQVALILARPPNTLIDGECRADEESPTPNSHTGDLSGPATTLKALK